MYLERELLLRCGILHLSQRLLRPTLNDRAFKHGIRMNHMNRFSKIAFRQLLKGEPDQLQCGSTIFSS